MTFYVNQLEPSMERLVDSTYARNDLVALSSPIPEACLDAGIWGHVLNLLPNAMVEVEFQTWDGEVMTVAAVPQEALCLVWSEGAIA